MSKKTNKKNNHAKKEKSTKLRKERRERFNASCQNSRHRADKKDETDSAKKVFKPCTIDVLLSWLPFNEKRSNRKHKTSYKFTAGAKRVLLISFCAIIAIGVLSYYGIQFLNDMYDNTDEQNNEPSITADQAYSGITRNQYETIEATGKFDRFMTVSGVSIKSIYDGYIDIEDAQVLSERDQLSSDGIKSNKTSEDDANSNNEDASDSNNASANDASDNTQYYTGSRSAQFDALLQGNNANAN